MSFYYLPFHFLPMVNGKTFAFWHKKSHLFLVSFSQLSRNFPANGRKTFDKARFWRENRRQAKTIGDGRGNPANYLKTVDVNIWGFDSLSLRQSPDFRGFFRKFWEEQPKY
ncbi:MAG: hypothetical protein DBY05_08855 [Clostridiales bacterium]|nr:MAG: hypothetical protein DBY05_08855 [Clostridiales bacterium]